MLRVSLNKAQVDRTMSALKGIPLGAPKAIAEAINHTLPKAKTSLSREVRAEYNLKAKTIKDTLQIRKAWANKKHMRLSGSIESAGGPMPLVNYGARQTGRGVTVLVKKKTGRKLIPHAFMTSGLSQKLPHKGIFIRSIDGGKRVGRLPIEELFGPSVPSTVENEAVMDRIMDQTQKDLVGRLDRNVDHLLKTSGKWAAR